MYVCVCVYIFSATGKSRCPVSLQFTVYHCQCPMYGRHLPMCYWILLQRSCLRSVHYLWHVTAENVSIWFSLSFWSTQYSWECINASLKLRCVSLSHKKWVNSVPTTTVVHRVNSVYSLHRWMANIFRQYFIFSDKHLFNCLEHLCHISDNITIGTVALDGWFCCCFDFGA